MALKRAVLWSVLLVGNCLTSESVQGSALSLQGVDDVHSCDGLPLGVLCVCNGITDYIFQEDFEYTSGLFVDESGDSLHTTSAGQTTDSWLGNTLDVVTKNFPVNLVTMKKYHCQTAMKIIGKLCNRQHTVICPKCSVTIDNIAVHTLQYCRENENVRLKLGKV